MTIPQEESPADHEFSGFKTLNRDEYLIQII